MEKIRIPETPLYIDTVTIICMLGTKLEKVLKNISGRPVAPWRNIYHDDEGLYVWEDDYYGHSDEKRRLTNNPKAVELFLAIRHLLNFENIEEI